LQYEVVDCLASYIHGSWKRVKLFEDGEEVKITFAGSNPGMSGDGFLSLIKVNVWWKIVRRIFVYPGRCTDGNLTYFMDSEMG
jgi:hypothetical protein